MTPDARDGEWLRTWSIRMWPSSSRSSAIVIARTRSRNRCSNAARCCRQNTTPMTAENASTGRTAPRTRRRRCERSFMAANDTRQPRRAPAVSPRTRNFRTTNEKTSTGSMTSAAGGDLAPLPALVVHEIDDGDGGGHRLRAREDQRKEEIVPRIEEAQDRGGGEARRRQRQHDADESLPQAGPVDPRGLLQRARRGVEERPHQPDDEREIERQVDDHQ